MAFHVFWTNNALSIDFQTNICNIQGLILSKDLKAKKDVEDESTSIAFGNLRFEVIELHHNVVEKEEMLNTLASYLIGDRSEVQKISEEKDNKVSKLENDNAQSVKHIVELEAQIQVQVEAHKAEMAKLKRKIKKLMRMLNQKKVKREIAEAEKNIVEKNVEELRESKE